MIEVLLVVHLLLALALIGVVLMQRSEGGALGIGQGGMGSLFSSRGAANVLTRATALLAISFFITSIALTMLARQGQGPASVFDSVKPDAQGQPGGGARQGGSVLPELPALPTPSQPQVPVGQ
jgi:preprotein translocase subunit SecG